jgi:acyl carrier protein
MMNETEIRTQLRGWIYDRAKDKPESLRDDTPILDGGILSSLDIVEFVLFIENLRGSEVDVDALQPDSFQDVDSIFKSFFAG